MHLSTEKQPVIMEKREQIKLERVKGDKNRVNDSDAVLVWYDSAIDPRASEISSVFRRSFALGYTGVLLYPHNFQTLAPFVPERVNIAVKLEDAGELAALAGEPLFATKKAIVASASAEVLEQARRLGLATCMCAYVDDGASLHESIRLGAGHNYLMIRFRDPTNIPLELVIASLQATHTVLIKEIIGDDVDDALVTLGVMEVGADGVMFSPTRHDLADRLRLGLQAIEAPGVKIEVGTVIRSVPIGMGYRSCLDLCTLFSQTEGMLVGSTSQGGILACPEVFFLPYMELRPFRVNAGAVHSYVYNTGDRTDYMSELRAGTSVMIVGVDGKARRAPIGRVKTEVRPLRLIEVEFAGGERVNTIMQDDWHVRIFSADEKPRNITELQPGDRVLGHVARPGRHVGIKVDEHIVEN
jgi:3-dehydroquinate synthase II/3-amino-4-hydroxybenzoic acid synthase